MPVVQTREVAVDQEEQFDALMVEWEKEADELKCHIYVLVQGAKDADGASWCGDCVTAEPVIFAALAQLKEDVMLVECPVGRNKYKGIECADGACYLNKGSKHPYKTHKELGLTAVPTLFRWAKGKAVSKLVEGHCSDPAAVAAFFQK
mmetsp:Transcript_7829/g.8962  ORF Transcript_7829/g.8962 Transcript_7829/m.8962 type:complete len:148 (-) Transcript_7829:141-584(-)